MKRLAALILLTVLSPLARAGTPLYVVKILSFDCAECRAAQAIDAAVASAANAAGAAVVYAPLPRQESDVREQFFYAMRQLGIDDQVMSALFSGSQGLGYPLMTQSEVLDWLHSSLSADSIDWDVVLRKVNDGESEAAVRRAILLAYRAGVTRYPSYVFVRGQKVLGMLDIATAGGSLSQLRSAVIERIEQLSTTSGA